MGGSSELCQLPTSQAPNLVWWAPDLPRLVSEQGTNNTAHMGFTAPDSLNQL